MNKVKWLWSTTIGVGLVLLYAAPSAYFVDTQGFYKALELPVFALSGLWMTVGWSAVYLADVAVISRLVYYRKSAYLIAAAECCGFLNAVWCIVFFRCGALGGAFALAVFMTALVLALAVFLAREDGFSLIFWQLKLVWYAYSTIAAYYVMCLN